MGKMIFAATESLRLFSATLMLNCNLHIAKLQNCHIFAF